jgi:hypothetical protein
VFASFVHVLLPATLQIQGVECVFYFQEVCSEADRNVPEGNGVDNEDSINLTIGEDEEKLLAEEVSSYQFCSFHCGVEICEVNGAQS